ncbi:MAG: Ig-like domain-containing protein [Clostridia bacterium]
MERNRLFTQDFSAPLDARWDYRQDDSEMEIKDCELRIKGGVPAFLMEAGKPEWRDYSVSGRICLHRLYANGQAGICARVSNDMKYCYQLVIAGRGELRLMKNTDEWEILWKKPFDYEKDRWYTLNLNVTGNTVEATMDGEHLVTYVDEDADFRKIPCGGIGLVMHHGEMRVSEIAVQGEESAIPVMGVFVYKQSVTLPLGSKRKLSAVAYPGEASDRTILWESSDPEVARVDCDGWVFALKEGRTGMIRQREQRNVPCTPFRRREIESGSARRERICLRAGSPSICEREPIA